MKSIIRYLFGSLYWVNYSNTLSYKGSWRKGVFHGFGELKYKNGTTYKGLFEAGSKHGYGSLISTNGYQYHGDWFRGQKNGNAKVNYKDGSTYEGYVKDGLRHGLGKFKDAQSGLELIGNWASDVLKGEVQIIGSHWVFSGPLPTNEGEALAKMEYDDGSIYRGGIKDFMRHGEGKMQYASGESIKGKWQKDQHVFNATKFDKDGTTWTGNFVNLKPHGYMRVSLASGNTYDGVWDKGSMLRTLHLKNRSKSSFNIHVH